MLNALLSRRQCWCWLIICSWFWCLFSVSSAFVLWYVQVPLLRASSLPHCGSGSFHSLIAKNLNYSNKKNPYEYDDELQARLARVHKDILQREEQRPPNPNLSPRQVIWSLLSALMSPDEPLPEAGFRLLIRTATPEWRNIIRTSIGAPDHANEELIASALGTAVSRPNNQFEILVGVDADQNAVTFNRKTSSYCVFFPSDVVDYDDGNCWLECQLRGRLDDKLLVIMGWQMRRREDDDAWLIEGIDWQDFRDEYRPGIGREEWMRICG